VIPNAAHENTNLFCKLLAADDENRCHLFIGIPCAMHEGRATGKD
jgi:hypothetical protein